MAMKPNTFRLTWFDWLAFVLIVIGALNWGLVGFFAFDLVGAIFGGTLTVGARIIFAIVGLAGLWSVYALWKVANMRAMRTQEEQMRRAA